MFTTSRIVPAAAMAAVLISASCGNDETAEPDQSAPEQAAADTDTDDRSDDPAEDDDADNDQEPDDERADPDDGDRDNGDNGDDDSAAGNSDADGPSTLSVAGGPFDELNFPTVQCDGDAEDFLLQSRSDDPAVVVTVLFTGGIAVQASAQTDPDEGESTIWSDQDPQSVGASITRDGDSVELTDTELVPFEGDDPITVSGTLTCNESLSS